VAQIAVCFCPRGCYAFINQPELVDPPATSEAPHALDKRENEILLDLR
jgi:hypothetical protein